MKDDEPTDAAKESWYNRWLAGSLESIGMGCTTMIAVGILVPLIIWNLA